MKIRILIISIIIVGGGLVVFALANAATEPPPQVCGDGIIQSPEKCDDGTGTHTNPAPTDTARCTAQCGEKMLGWAWSDTFGWLSLNQHNCDPAYLDSSYAGLQPPICGPQDIPYFVQVTANNEVYGMAWSDNAGWVCIGNGHGNSGQGCTNAPPGSTSAQNAMLVANPSNSEEPLVTGWAQILALGNQGWISLNCQNDNGCSTSNYTTRLFKGTFGSGQGPTEQRYTLNGWGWNDLDGWFQFYPTVNGIPAWLQTKYGDIYARGGLSGQKAPGYNATYRILSSGSVEQFTSAQGTDNFWVSPNLGPINFPTPETGFSNVLGKLDVNSLLCNFTAGGTCINRFGTTVVNLNQPGQSLQSNQTMGGKNYYYKCTNTKPTISNKNSILFNNGTGFTNGAGTIIVDADSVGDRRVPCELDINAPSWYATSTPDLALKNLASVVWIVRGDVKIAPTVADVAGNFIIIGNGTAKVPNGCDPIAKNASCGQFYTCDSADQSSCGNPLDISGLVMARKFYFNRTYRNQARGSEVILYDGRLLANTPPGVSDFAKSLPIWRSGSFSQ